MRVRWRRRERSSETQARGRLVLLLELAAPDLDDATKTRIVRDTIELADEVRENAAGSIARAAEEMTP